MLRELDETEGGRDVSRGHGGDLQRSQQAVCVHVCASGRGEGWVFGGGDVEAPYGHPTPCTPHPCKQADVKWDVPP